MHLEWRARQGKGHQRMVQIVQECLVWLLGVGLGLLVGSMTIAARVSRPPHLISSTLPLPCLRLAHATLVARPSSTLACPHVRSPLTSP